MGRIELPASPLPRECSTTELHGPVQTHRSPFQSNGGQYPLLKTIGPAYIAGPIVCVLGGGTRNRTRARLQVQMVTHGPRERGFDDLAVSGRRVAISSRQIRGRTDSGIPGAGQGAWSTTGYTASPHMAFGLSIITAMITGTSLPSRRVQSRNWSRLTLPFHVAPPWIS